MKHSSLYHKYKRMYILELLARFHISGGTGTPRLRLPKVEESRASRGEMPLSGIDINPSELNLVFRY